MKTQGGAKAFLLIGTLLLAMVRLSPFVFSVISLIVNSEPVFDYLMTAELGFVAIIALLFLMVGTFLAKGPFMLFVVSSVVSVVSLVILMLLSDPPMFLAVSVLILYNLSLVSLLLHGVLSLK
ncbi:hypothetical protein SAMN06298221_105157 [Sphaerochaeta associata]|uniref:Uncharacterized protein n=1 Tax=Sphaerochaeta associata TaxID=1129264 RepID=A0ABY4DB56_9SPIR|nr:hypothetical protein [Sphaerochaeta associata]UOM51269.1 hypothetical protein MUG09_00585 [Sphaerochaeta associata]SMP50877.1 hypothetical protein SAMN06298221_105157 [Sphaerochaeta associata]